VSLPRSGLAAALLTLAALLAGAAQAQPGPREQRGEPAGAFDFYVLALSWSPGFCELNPNARSREQCEPGRPSGFVVHGLWPQNEAGYPSFCEPSNRPVPRGAVDEAAGLFPDEGLARYQWRKHGSCSGLAPSEYFRAVRQVRERVRVPDRLQKPGTDTKALPLEIERAFAEANPGLRPEMMAVACGRRVFQEIRLCLTKDLRSFRACPEVDRDGCRAGEITINAVR
jgi:ribonuclease T2